MGIKSSLLIGKREDCGFMEGEGGGEGVGSGGSSFGTCESTASSRRDLLLLIVSPSEIDDTESASFPAFPSSRILLFPEPHVESDSSAGKTADRVARFGLFVPFFLVSLGIVCLP